MVDCVHVGTITKCYRHNSGELGTYEYYFRANNLEIV